ncbi:MAG: hypothetical protein GXY86_11740, partial [Firmicutes bacterium]|nr:hypothetical protein [Bacillota bacterium]
MKRSFNPYRAFSFLVALVIIFSGSATMSQNETQSPITVDIPPGRCLVYFIRTQTTEKPETLRCVFIKDNIRKKAGQIMTIPPASYCTAIFDPGEYLIERSFDYYKHKPFKFEANQRYFYEVKFNKVKDVDINTIYTLDTKITTTTTTNLGNTVDFKTLSQTKGTELLSKYKLYGAIDTNKMSWTVLDNSILTLSGHSDTVRQITFNLDGKIIVSHCDETLRLWDGATGNLLTTISGHDQKIKCMALSAD